MTLIKKETGVAEHVQKVAKVKRQQHLKILANIALQKAHEALCKTCISK